MKRFSRPIVGLVSGIAGALAVFAAVQHGSFARETNAVPPQFKIQDAPIDRQTHGVTSYAPIIKRAAPSVVNIYSSRTLPERQMQMNPLFNDPMFRRFFQQDPSQGPEDDGNGPPPRSHRFRPQKAQSLGSGVIVSPEGYILTANHVVEGADEIKVSVANGEKYTAKVVGTDPPTDVAVLKIAASNLPAISIADSDKLEVGDVVIAIGNPFDVGQTVTMGIVSAVGRNALDINEYENFIQTDAAINPGNSGGALVDAEGRLIGINTAIYSRSGGYQGLGFAVPVNLARAVMERLINFGKVTRGYIGVTLQESISPSLVKEFNLPDSAGAMVGGVNANTPAAEAGIKEGDVIREVDGKKIVDRSQLRLMISQMVPGSKVAIKLLRSDAAGKKPVEKTVNVTLGTLPEDRALGRNQSSPQPEGTPADTTLDGVQVADLDTRSRRQFRIPANVHGAFVMDVDEDSKSAEAGLRPGDVIVEMNRQPVHGADDAIDMSRKNKGDHVLLRVWRNGSSFYIPIEIAKANE